MNFRFLYNKYNGLYEGIVRPPFHENCTEIEPYFDFACKTIYDFHKGNWKLVSREEFYAQMIDHEKLNDLDIKCLDKLELVHKHLLETNHATQDEIIDLGKNINSVWRDTMWTCNKLINIHDVLLDVGQDLKHDNDLIAHNVEHELKFIKSQIHYLTTILERPSLWTRLKKLIFFWQ